MFNSWPSVRDRRLTSIVALGPEEPIVTSAMWRLTAACLLILLAVSPTESRAAFNEQIRLRPPNASEFGWYGYSVALSGDRALIGDHGEDPNGAAYVLEPDAATGKWLPVATLMPPVADPVVVGNAVDIHGNSAVVAGRLLNAPEGANDGAAYFFERQPDGQWQSVGSRQFAGTVSERLGAGDDIVALHGDFAVAGAAFDDSTAQHAGSAYVFERNLGGPNAWGQAAKLVPDDLLADDRFGTSVDVWGDRIVVGAMEGGENSEGALYVFERNGSDWQQTAKLTSPHPQTNGLFGRSASLWGDRILVGAYRESHPGGAAYLFHEQDGVWNLEAEFFSPVGSIKREFGTSVALTDGLAVVGEPSGPISPPGSESAYVFGQDELGAWHPLSTLVGSDAVPEDMFGHSVAVSNGRVLVGAFYSNADRLHAGAAYLFVPEPATGTLLAAMIPAMGLWLRRCARRRA